MSIFSYTVEIDTLRDGTFGDALDDVTGYVEYIEWSSGLSIPWGRVAPPATMRLMLANTDGRFSTHDSGATYYGLLTKGMLVRIQATYGVTTETLCVLKVKDIDIPARGAGSSASSVVTLICTDVMPLLLQTQYNAPLLLDVRIDEALQLVYDNATIIYPYDGYYFFIGVDSIGGDKILFGNSITDFDEAYTTLPYIGDNMDNGRGIQAQAYIKDLVSAEPNSIFFFQPRDETFKFFNKYHNKILAIDPVVFNTSQGTFTKDDYVAVVQRHGEEIINDMQLNFSPRSVGVPGTVVYSSNSVPFALPAQSTRSFTFRYKDNDNPSASIGAMDVIEPEPGVDIVGNSAPDGSGSDWTQYIVVDRFEAHAGSYELDIFANKVGDPVYITKNQARGTPIINYEMESVSAYDGISVSQYDKHSKVETIKSISDVDQAQDYVNFMVDVFAIPETYIREVTFVADEASAGIALKLLQLTCGDVVTLTDDTGVAKDYMIVGEKHVLPSKTEVHRITWIVRPIERGSPFIIGTSEIGGTDILV